MSKSAFGQDPQPSNAGEKSNVAREVMGLATGKAAGRAPKFHSIHIASAENGAILDHTEKLNPNGPDKSHKVVVPHDHPVMEHIRAIHEHCTDCSE